MRRDVVIVLREWAAGKGSGKFAACEPVLTRAADEIERLRGALETIRDLGNKERGMELSAVSALDMRIIAREALTKTG